MVSMVQAAEGRSLPRSALDSSRLPYRSRLQARIGTTRARMDAGPDAAGTALTERELRGDLITAEDAELSRLYHDGTISAATLRWLQRNLDLETARLTDGHQ